MPVIFIHGVNTRESEQYRIQESQRNGLLRTHVLEPLAARDPRFDGMQIVSPYWGDLGVVFGWNQATLPAASLLEHLGSDDTAEQLADLDLSERLATIARTTPARSGQLESLGASSTLRTAMLTDPENTIDALLKPVPGTAGKRLEVDSGDSADVLGQREAQLTTAGYDVARNSATRTAVEQAATDDEVLSVIQERIKDRYAQLLGVDPLSPRTNELEPLGGRGHGTLETLGAGDWARDLISGAGAVIERARNLPGRAVTVSALALKREGTHRNLSQFMGDVFVYLARRDIDTGAERIWERIQKSIRAAQRQAEHEPTVVITHSMGGNVLYDILTHYDTSLTVDFWASVGGQVGQFEEMKIFKSSDPTLVAPMRVSGPKPRAGYWLNVYDPADIFSFKVGPVFSEVDADVAFPTGEAAPESHGAYFRRPAFYELLREHLQKAIA